MRVPVTVPVSDTINDARWIDQVDLEHSGELISAWGQRDGRSDLARRGESPIRRTDQSEEGYCVRLRSCLRPPAESRRLRWKRPRSQKWC